MENFDMNATVTVRPLGQFETGFKLRTQQGSIAILPNTEVRLTRNEIANQVNYNNKLFCGTDRKGSHASLYIEDEATRRYLGFEDDEAKQNIITTEKVLEAFEIKSQKKFESAIRSIAVTEDEKQFVLKTISESEIDSYKKIEFCKEYCKFSLRG